MQNFNIFTAIIIEIMIQVANSVYSISHLIDRPDYQCDSYSSFIIYKVRYRKILMKYNVYFIFSLVKNIKFYIFTPL